MYNFTYKYSGGEVEEYRAKDLCIGLVKPYFITYTLSPISTTSKQIMEPIELLLLTTTNPAHSICEFISFYDYFGKEITRKIGINTLIIEKMPYLWQIIKLFIPADRILILQQNKLYSFNSLFLRQNAHFVYTNNWSECAFTLVDKVMTFNNLQGIRDTYSVSCAPFFSKIKEIYEAHKHQYQLHDSIMIIKNPKEKLCVTPHRALEYPADDVLAVLEASSIRLIQISDFADIYEYICTLYHAKKLIFSYGGPMCVNRFFCNPEASIVVLANLHYRSEYESDQAYSHLRQSMLAPVQSQIFLLDIPNRVTVEHIHLITKLLV